MNFAEYESIEVRGVSRHCPDCAGAMTSTGRLKLDVESGQWYVEYLCDADGRLRDIWSPETQTLVESAAKQRVTS